jgi:uncharacterized protein (DUF1778 family)
MPSAPHSVDSSSNSRDTRIEARLTSSQKALIQRAADIRRQKLSEFVLASAADAARKIIDQHATIRLTLEEQVALVETLLDSPAPSARLRRAAQAYRGRLTDSQ